MDEINPSAIAAPLPTARQQLSVVAWMRWRMVANGFRRLNDKAIAVRIISYLFTFVFVCFFGFGSAVLCGFIAYLSISTGHPHYLYFLLWGLFLVWHFVSLNSAVAVATVKLFDETTLIRFPLTLTRYLVLKLAASLMTVGFLISIFIFSAIAIGIGIANFSLFLPAACSMALFLAFNLLLARSLQTWVNRWLSTRRTREIFTVFLSLLIFAPQIVLRLPSVRHRLFGVGSYLAGFASLLFNGPLHLLFAIFPPSLAAGAVVETHRALQLLDFALLLFLIPAVLALYVWRVRKQFHGELFTDGPAAPKPEKSKPKSKPAPAAIAVPTSASGSKVVSPVLACLQKEWAVQRRSGAMFANMLSPLVFVVILAAPGQLLARHPSYALPSLVGYSMMNVLSLGFNLFGVEGTGIQFYLIAPIRIRDIVLSKHILSFAFALIQATLATAVAFAMTRSHASAGTIVSALSATLFWTLFVIFINFAAGIYRSIARPIRIDPNKVSLSRRNSSGSRSGGWILFLVFFGSLIFCVPVLMACDHFHHPWWPTPLFALLAAAAAGFYARTLSRSDDLFFAQREQLTQALTKSV